MLTMNHIDGYKKNQKKNGKKIISSYKYVNFSEFFFVKLIRNIFYVFFLYFSFLSSVVALERVILIVN